MRTRIKFCGLTRPGDVRLAIELGVDAIGFIFARQSKRKLDEEQIEGLRQACSPLVSVIALFMDNTGVEVSSAIRALSPNFLQFHGAENDSVPDICAGTDSAATSATTGTPGFITPSSAAASSPVQTVAR